MRDRAKSATLRWPTNYRRTKFPCHLPVIFIALEVERMDEVDLAGWIRKSSDYPTARSSKYFMADTHITENGKMIAGKAGGCLAAVEGIGWALASNRIQVIFCSQLVRCVQTAFEIARRYNIPIIVSKALAFTASAVLQSDGKFEFASLSELRVLCPGVTIISCDSMTLEDLNDNSNKPVIDRLPAEPVFGPQPLYLPRIPVDPKHKDWISPLKHIAKLYDHSMVVCHRETIRNIWKKPVHLPYCAIAKCVYRCAEHDTNDVTHAAKRQRHDEDDGASEFEIQAVFDVNGNKLF